MIHASLRTAVLTLLVVAAASLPPPATAAGTLHRLYNLDYNDGGIISVFQVVNGEASLATHFKPSSSGAHGLAADRQGRIYTTVTSPGGMPCKACVEVFSPAGSLVAQLAAPILPGASGAPNLTDISVDLRGNVYVTDNGQQAVYYYTPAGKTWSGPTVVVQNSVDSSTILAGPYGDHIVLSGGCGFQSVRTYVRGSSGFFSGPCFPINDIALIGGATDDRGAVLTPVDGPFPYVSITEVNGQGGLFQIPDSHGIVTGIAVTLGGAIAYVADHHGGKVYAYARPTNGWPAATPALVATYAGFHDLDVIAVDP
jgi:sugar lactone lactonase YvrE